MSPRCPAGVARPGPIFLPGAPRELLCSPSNPGPLLLLWPYSCCGSAPGRMSFPARFACGCVPFALHMVGSPAKP